MPLCKPKVQEPCPVYAESILRKIVIDSDIILDHLARPAEKGNGSTPSVLRLAMSQLFCYTTVFNAIELFSLCASAKERQAVENVMQAMKILGLNGKSAKNVGAYLRVSRGRNLHDLEALVAGVCLESRLPLLTGRPRRYRGIRRLHLVAPEEIVSAHKKGNV